MKRMKKLLAVMLAAVMVMGMTTSVFAATYTVTIDSSITNGSVSVVGGTSASVSVDEGNTVTLTVTPDSGYELDTLTVTEETSGDTVTITQDTSDSSKYTFTMPDDNVTVTATFAKTYTITIENSTEDYTYVVYQIFTGDLSTDGKTLSNIEWGSDITTAGKSALIVYYSLPSDATASDVATAIVSADDAQALAEKLESDSSYLTGGTTMTYDSSAGTYSTSGLSAGYYLVVNTAVPSTGTGIAYSNYIVELLVDVTMEPKSDVPSVTKTVTDTSGNESDVTSASAGESVSFTLTATMPTNYADYDAYKLVFHDTLSTGLTYNDDVTVTVNTYVPDSTLTTFDSNTTYYTYNSNTGEYVEVDTTVVTTPVADTTYYTYVTTVVDSGYTVAPTYTEATGLTAFESGVTYYIYNNSSQKYEAVSSSATFDDSETYYYISSFTVTIADTNALYDATNATAITVNASSTIVVTYTATVNSQITAGTEETNTVYLEYSNNPTEEYDPSTAGSGEPSTGTTTEVITYVYTFDLSVTKTDDEGKALSGAKFSLYKQVTLTEAEFASNSSGAYYTISGTTATVADSAYSTSATYYVLVEEDIEAADDGNGAYIATFNDLGEGTYALVESETPSGYNTIDAVYFVIVATYKYGSITALEIQDTTGASISTGTDPTFTATYSTGEISTIIENVSGAKLPTTGGIGTTMFYVVGMILVLGAAVMLVTRRRVGR